MHIFNWFWFRTHRNRQMSRTQKELHTTTKTQSKNIIKVNRKSVVHLNKTNHEINEGSPQLCTQSSPVQSNAIQYEFINWYSSSIAHLCQNKNISCQVSKSPCCYVPQFELCYDLSSFHLFLFYFLFFFLLLFAITLNVGSNYLVCMELCQFSWNPIYSNVIPCGFVEIEWCSSMQIRIIFHALQSGFSRFSALSFSYFTRNGFRLVNCVALPGVMQ